MSRELTVHPAHQFEDLEQEYRASSLGMWIFLATEVLFFGGLFATYIVYRNAYPSTFAHESRHLDLILGTINTGILLASSLTMALAVHASQTGHQRALVGFLVITSVLGAGFLGIKATEYMHKYHEQLFPGVNFDPAHTFHGRGPAHEGRIGTIIAASENLLSIRLRETGRGLVMTVPENAEVTLDGRPVDLGVLQTEYVARVEFEERDGQRVATRVEAKSYRTVMFYSLYFVMTGFHGLHVLIGVGLMAVLAVMARQGKFSSQYYTPVDMSGLYWHFVDIVWVYLYPLFYLIGVS